MQAEPLGHFADTPLEAAGLLGLFDDGNDCRIDTVGPQRCLSVVLLVVRPAKPADV
jgi:hypothetical protein